MSERLTEPARHQLGEIQQHLGMIASFLQEMTGSVQAISWDIEDALWDDWPPAKPHLEFDADRYSDKVRQLTEMSDDLLAAVNGYVRPPISEHQAALNALHNAGMLAPQEEPPEDS